MSLLISNTNVVTSRIAFINIIDKESYFILHYYIYIAITCVLLCSQIYSDVFTIQFPKKKYITTNNKPLVEFEDFIKYSSDIVYL